MSIDHTHIFFFQRECQYHSCHLHCPGFPGAYFKGRLSISFDFRSKQNVANVPETTATPSARSALGSNKVTPTPQPSENVPDAISTLGGALSLAALLPGNISGSPTPEFHPLPVHPRDRNPATPSTSGAPSDAAHSESSAPSSLTLSSTAEEPERPPTPKPLRITAK